MMGTTEHMVMAHGGPRISEMGGQPQRWWRQPIILANFARKLHGNEKKWTAVLALPLDPPMKANKIYKLEML